MTKFTVKGSDCQIGKVQRLGESLGVILEGDWEGADVVVVKDGELEGYGTFFPGTLPWGLQSMDY